MQYIHCILGDDSLKLTRWVHDTASAPWDIKFVGIREVFQAVCIIESSIETF